MPNDYILFPLSSQYMRAASPFVVYDSHNSAQLEQTNRWTVPELLSRHDNRSLPWLHRGHVILVCLGFTGLGLG